MKMNLRQPKIYVAAKDKKTSKWPVIFFFGGIFLAVAGLIFYFFFISAFFQIKTVQIIGSPPSAMANQINNLKGHNLFSFSSNKLEKTFLAQNHDFSSVKFYRGIPDTIRVVFNYREPKIIWQTGDSKYLVDASGTAFATLTNQQNLPLVIDEKNIAINLPSQVATPNFINFVVAARDSLAKSGFAAQDFEVTDTIFQVTVLVDKGFRIKLNLLRPLSDQIDALNQVYAQSKSSIKEYIDVRVEGWVYYK